MFTLSVNDDIKFLENVKQQFRTRISWTKYRSEMTTQTKSNNLDYLIHPTFRNFNRSLFHSFYKYYMSLVEIIDFNTLINDSTFFYPSVKNT